MAPGGLAPGGRAGTGRHEAGDGEAEGESESREAGAELEALLGAQVDEPEWLRQAGERLWDGVGDDMQSGSHDEEVSHSGGEGMRLRTSRRSGGG